MDINILGQYLMPTIMIVCLCVGYVVKKWVNDVDNKYIPTIVAILGVFLAVWNSGWAFSIETIVTGLVSGLASTGMHQAVTQYFEEKSDF